MKISLIGQLYKTFQPKQVRESFKVQDFVISYPDERGRTQYRRMQAINQSVDHLKNFQDGDLIKIEVYMKGKYNDKGFVMNLDEVHFITKPQG